MAGMERNRKLYEEGEVRQIINEEAYRTRIGVVLSALHHDLIRTNAPGIYIETVRDILADYGYPMEEPPQAPPEPIRHDQRQATVPRSAAAPAGSDPDGNNERHTDVMAGIIGKGKRVKTE